jgi:hypothetical protein
LTEFLNVVKPKIKCVWNLTAAPLPIKVASGYLSPSEPFVPLDDQKSFPFLMLEASILHQRTGPTSKSLCIGTWIVCIEELLDEIEIEDLAQKGENGLQKQLFSPGRGRSSIEDVERTTTRSVDGSSTLFFW